MAKLDNDSKRKVTICAVVTTAILGVAALGLFGWYQYYNVFNGSSHEISAEEVHDHEDHAFSPDGMSENDTNTGFKVYNNMFIPYEVEDEYHDDMCMSYYCTFNLEELYDSVLSDYDVDTCRFESRGIHLDVVYNGASETGKNGPRMYIEHEIDANDANTYYVKITDSETPNQQWWVIKLSSEDGQNYTLNKEAVTYSDVKDKLQVISDEPNPWIDNRVYAEYLVDYYTNVLDIHRWEGYDGPLTVDMMMDIMNYN